MQENRKHFMEKKPQSHENTGNETAKTNEHKDMPVKTKATDTLKNTAAQEGLNRANTDNNEIAPGTTPPGDE